MPGSVLYMVSGGCGCGCVLSSAFLSLLALTSSPCCVEKLSRNYAPKNRTGRARHTDEAV